MTNYDHFNLSPFIADTTDPNYWTFFTTYQQNIYDFALTYYTGLARPLIITEKLGRIWTDFNRAWVKYGKIALVDYGSEWLLAKVKEGKRNLKNEWVGLKLVFLHEENEREFEPASGSYVIFCWNPQGWGFTLNRLQNELYQLWDTKKLIAWDQQKSKKRAIINFEKRPEKTELKEILEDFETGYIGVLTPGKAGEVKDWKWSETRNTTERQQLWQDKAEIWSEMCIFLGIRHNPFAKQERQNNPEIQAGQSYFDKWEKEHLEQLIKGLLELQEKEWGKEEAALIHFGNIPPVLITKNQFRNYSKLEEAEEELRAKGENILLLEELPKSLTERNMATE
jgi:hypothetical protein